MWRKVLIVSLLTILFPHSGFIHPELARGGGIGEKVIYPGKGVGRLGIGEMAPDERIMGTIARQEKIDVVRSGGRIEKVRVTSPLYYVTRNQLRVGQSTLGDVMRFYGKGKSEVRGALVILRYPSQGIEFEVDKSEDRVAAITVFRPAQAEVSPEQIRKLYQYREQFKR